MVGLAYGCSARIAKQAVEESRAKGAKAGLFRPVTVWPFPEKPFLEAVERARTIVVPEMNRGQYVNEAMRVLYQGGMLKNIVKINELGSVMIHPDRIVQAIMEEK